MDQKSLRYLMDQPNLNMRQHRWIDVVKNYDCEILCHLGKVNVVTNALSCKAANSFIETLWMRILVDYPLLDLIRGDQADGVKENWKWERLMGEVDKLDTHN